MFYFLILAFWINVNNASGSAAGCSSCGSGVKGAYDSCSGIGCRVYYHQLPRTQGDAYQPKATKSVPWKSRFASKEDEDPKMPNLDEKKWEEIIEKHWPGVLTTAARPAWDLVAEPWNAAMSLEALELIMTTLTDIVAHGLDGGAGYKNPHNPAGAGGPTKEKKIDEINMHDINQMLVSPMARGLSVPFATIARIVKPSYSGPITTFISHDWSEPFKNFLETVQKHCSETSCTKATTYYWVCTFANNQWNFDAGNTQQGYDYSSPFGKALNQAAPGSPYQVRAGLKSALFIQSDVPEFLNIDRVWCVFELNLLINLELPIYWGCQDKVTKFAVGAKNICSEDSKKRLSAWTVDGTGVTVQADKDMIIQYVQTKNVKALVGASASDGKGSLKEFLTAFNSDAGLPASTYLTNAAKHTVETKEESSLSNNLLVQQEIEPEVKVKESVWQIPSSWVTFLGGMFAGMSLLVVVRFAQSGVNEKLEQQYSFLLDSQNEC